MKPIIVKVQPWDWSDEDGCSDSGVSVWINDVLVSQYGNSTSQLLLAVIYHLTGKPVEVYGYKDNDPIAEDDAWEWRL